MLIMIPRKSRDQKQDRIPCPVQIASKSYDSNNIHEVALKTQLRNTKEPQRVVFGSKSKDHATKSDF